MDSGILMIHDSILVCSPDPTIFCILHMDELVHMRLEGTMAELLVRIDPKLYRKYVQMVNGKQVLYVELKKALHGTI
jgi:hypothetical protein